MKIIKAIICAFGIFSFAYGLSTKHEKSHVRSKETYANREEYLRSQYNLGHGYDKSQLGANNKHQRGINLMERARTFLRSHSRIIPKIHTLLADMPNLLQFETIPDQRTDYVCPQYGDFQCPIKPTVSDDYEIIDSVSDPWRRLVDILVDDTDECTACVDFWTNLKDLVCTNDISWPIVRYIFINLCQSATELPISLDPVICNGTITIQGEHAYCIVLQADPRNLCESMNNCFPPDNREGRPPVSDRTPWAVKAKLETLGKWPPQQEVQRRRANAMTPEGDKYIKVAALADIHLQMKHAIGSAVTECMSDVCCLEDFDGKGAARYWGEYTCNLPMHTLQLFLDRVSDMHPDFVIYAGDSPPHTMWDESEASQQNCSRIVVDAMTKSFGANVKIYPAVGNHEMYPTNLFSTRIGETQRMMQRFTELWSGPAGFDIENNGTFANMSYYTLLVPSHPRLRIVTINAVLDWYAVNFYATLNEHTAENVQHKQWVNDTLRDARRNDEKVIIISHHPVGGGDSNIRSARWWEEIIIAYSDVIVLHLSGHTHSDELKLSFDPKTMEAVAVNHIAPSTNSKTYINPSMMVYYLDPTNFTLVDYESFHLEIKDQEQSIGVPPAIRFGYSALEEYGMSDLSPESYRNLIIRFTEDDALFQKYSQNRNSHSSPDLYCDHECKIREICLTWFPELDEANECMTLAPPEDITTTSGEFTDGAKSNAQNAILILVLTMMSRLLMSIS